MGIGEAMTLHLCGASTSTHEQLFWMPKKTKTFKKRKKNKKVKDSSDKRIYQFCVVSPTVLE